MADNLLNGRGEPILALRARDDGAPFIKQERGFSFS